MLKKTISLMCIIPFLLPITLTNNTHESFKSTMAKVDKVSIETELNTIERGIFALKEQRKINMLNEIGQGLVVQQQEQMKADEEQREIERQQEIERQRESDKYKKRVTFHITYYTSSKSGRDKSGTYIHSYNYPVIALPKDIPYGVKVIFDESVLGEYQYTNVDTGGAIRWINSSECKVDVFIPNVTDKWIINNTQNKIVEGWIVYK